MRKKITASVLAVVLLVLCFSSCSLTGEKATEYKETEGGLALYRYTESSTETEFVIPDEVDGKPVVKVDRFGMANAEYLTKITIGKNVSEIDIWAFTNCSKLEAFEVDPENRYFTAIDGVLYNKDVTEILFYPNGKTPLIKDDKEQVIGGGEYVAPATLKSIRANAFYVCWNLYSVTLNEGLETIGNKAFIKCDNVRTLNIPSTVTKIGDDALSYMNTLTSLEIPSSVTEIGDYAFFATETILDKIVIHNKRENIKIGKNNDLDDTNWLPNKTNTFGTKIGVEFVED